MVKLILIFIDHLVAKPIMQRFRSMVCKEGRKGYFSQKILKTLIDLVQSGIYFVGNFLPK